MATIKEQIRAEIERLKERAAAERVLHPQTILAAKNYLLIKDYDNLLSFLDTLPEQPVIDHHEIEVEFRGEKVTVNREFYRKEDKNYSTNEQDDNVIWAALRAWCEKKGITAFELYPQPPEQPVEGLEEAAEEYNKQVIEETKCHHNALTYAEGYEDALLLIPEAFIAGAEWQKIQDQKTIELAEDHAMLAGMNKMEQQMMEKAVEGKIIKSYNPVMNAGGPSLHGIELIYPDEGKPHLLAGDKVRIIVIKEDEK